MRSSSTSTPIAHPLRRSWAATAWQGECGRGTRGRPGTCPLLAGRSRRCGEEAERLIAACSDHFRPLVIFLLYTGARVGSGARARSPSSLALHHEIEHGAVLAAAVAVKVRISRIEKDLEAGGVAESAAGDCIQ